MKAQRSNPKMTYNRNEYGTTGQRLRPGLWLDERGIRHNENSSTEQAVENAVREAARTAKKDAQETVYYMELVSMLKIARSAGSPNFNENEIFVAFRSNPDRFIEFFQKARAIERAKGGPMVNAIRVACYLTKLHERLTGEAGPNVRYPKPTVSKALETASRLRAKSA